LPEARKYWNSLRKIAGHKTIRAVSTRFTNRLDIPVKNNKNIDLSEYLNVGIVYPSVFAKMQNNLFHVNSQFIDLESKHGIIMQVSTVPSALIDHSSFTLDLDVSTIEPIPPNEEKVWDIINNFAVISRTNYLKPVYLTRRGGSSNDHI
jgi:uncharacterized protein (TIGR04255 family)